MNNRKPATDAALLDNRYHMGGISDILATLRRAQGLANFAKDALILAEHGKHYHELDREAIGRLVEALALDLADAIALVDDYHDQQHGKAAKEGRNERK